MEINEATASRENANIGILFFRFTASRGIILFLKTSYLNLKHVYTMAIITRDALRAARVKKRVGYLFRCRRRRVFIFFRRSHKW